MEATLTRPEAPLTVSEARRRLANTRGLSPEEVGELERVVAAFHAARPINRACVACGSMIWREHETAAGDSTWACSGCHRASSLTAEAWRARVAQEAAAAARRTAAEAAEAAPAPDSRAALSAALDRRSEAAAALDRLEQALPAARTALASAQVKHDAAVAAVADAERTAVARAAAALTGGPTPVQGITAGAARGNLRTAEDILTTARAARQLLDDQADQARRAVSFAENRVRSAALRVLAAEELEGLITAAINARANYAESIAALAFLIRARVIPNGDVRPHQLVSDADTAPAHTDGGMAERLAALEGSP
jgi:hypothetical protein